MTAGSPGGERILPYSRVVELEDLKLALELNFVNPRIGGVLITGDSGTGKSTAVRAFTRMTWGELPVTLPINATDDRVVGGWDIHQLMRREPVMQRGLLEEAADRGMLYIDEVNLLDDHIVNIILDAASTGYLTVQREGVNEERRRLDFGLVGTMNLEEGELRPQLLDRFGLMVSTPKPGAPTRIATLKTNLAFDTALDTPGSPWLAEAEKENEEIKKRLLAAKERLHQIDISSATDLCGHAAARLNATGMRGEIIAARSAQALAALDGADRIAPEHVLRVLPFAFRHRRPKTAHSVGFDWGPEHDAPVKDLFD